MTSIPLLRVATLAVAMGLSGGAMAACTDAQAEAKMTELTNMMGPLMSRNPALTQTIATEMQTAMLQPTSDETCATYDRLIVRAKSGR
jgi:sensor histidine kinase regulating citrate/malate metabolism